MVSNKGEGEDIIFESDKRREQFLFKYKGIQQESYYYLFLKASITYSLWAAQVETQPCYQSMVSSFSFSLARQASTMVQILPNTNIYNNSTAEPENQATRKNDFRMQAWLYIAQLLTE